jgi:hypothetical protein
MASLLLLAVGAMPAHAVTSTSQTLDRVFTFGPQKVIDMATGNAARPPDFTDTGITGSNLTTCTLTAVNGLYCLDGKSLRNWPNPDVPGTSTQVLNCADPGLDFDNRGEDCTAMTVDANGTIWLAGKRRKLYSVIKIIKKEGTCPTADWRTLTGGALCALEQYYGRPPLADVTPVDGDVADAFPYHAGVLGLEERKDVMFFPDPKTGYPVLLVSWKDWGFRPREELQEATLLQVPNGAVIDNYVVAISSTGRILAKNIALSGRAREVFNIPAQRGAVAKCNYQDQEHGIRASTTAQILYVSDRNYCQVLALLPDSPAFNNLVKLQRNSVDFVLSTAVPGPYPPIGLAVAPGLSVMLTQCNLSCAIVNSGTGAPAAKLQEVQLASSTNSGATVFQVKNIPDCRYSTYVGFPANLLALCSKPGVIVDPGATNRASGQWLNVTPLLPTQVINAFKRSGYGTGVLPDLLISPPYRGQKRNGYTFEALFMLTSPNTQYTSVFTGEFDVPGLEGSAGSLGCTPNNARLLDWDLVTSVSEYYVGYEGRKADMLINADCGSTKTVGVRLSLISYDLEPSPDTWGPTINSTTPKFTEGNDAVYARLLQRLYTELGYSQRELACKQVDPTPTGGTPPLNSTTCSTLASKWQEGKEKLDKCINGSFRSTDDYNHHHYSWWWGWFGRYFHYWNAYDEDHHVDYCQAFVDKVNAFKAQIPATPPAWDVANRISELKARITTLLHVYNTRFVPSIPANGFCRELTPIPADCPNPWTAPPPPVIL